jgi:hypothetical protein
MLLSKLFTERSTQFTDFEIRAVIAALANRSLKASQIAEAISAAGQPDVKPTFVLIGSGLGEVLSESAAKAALDAFTVDDVSTDWARCELLGAGEVSERLNIARATLDNWRRAGRALAFSKGVRNFIFPMAQFEGDRPVPGLNRVRKHFTSDEDAWEWLVIPNRMTGNEKPLDWLLAGYRDEVTKAAEGALDYS